MDDWQSVTEAGPWKVAYAHLATVTRCGQPFRATRQFSKLFPNLAELLGRARQTHLTLPTGPHTLFAWGQPKSDVRAWLCPIPPEVVSRGAAPDHRLLLKCFGGIANRFNEPAENWLLNHDRALVADEADRGAGFIAEYGWAFEKCGGIPIDLDKYYPAAWEANGNCVLASRIDGELLFFAPDHADQNLIPYRKCPMYTLHRHRIAGSLREWIESIAVQWTNCEK
jgi:hypothetical protein